jgi:hypothetical protein
VPGSGIMACVGHSWSVCGLIVEAAPVDEEDFWSRLEFRITRELSGFEDRQLRACWCDGLVADEYELHGAQPRIRGRAWCGPSGQERWTFTLLLDRAVGNRDLIDWSTLLPADDVTGWLIPEPQAETMTIDPSSAYPDPE